MFKFYRKALIVCFSIMFLFISLTPYSSANEPPPTIDELKHLLQQGLSIYEIDREIERLAEQETHISAQIEQTEQQIIDQEIQLIATREHAGKVLRSYYMGERDNLWMILLSSQSFTEAMAIYEFLTTILNYDRAQLDSYVSSSQELKSLRNDLLATETQLKQTKAEFISQKNRVIAMQKQLDEQLAKHDASAAQEVLKEMVDLTTSWQEIGLPIFRQYLEAISIEMVKLPELLTGDERGKYLNGLTFQISEQDLTRFLREGNPIFNSVNFSFSEGNFIVSGHKDTVEIGISGHYLIENIPVNQLKFKVDELVFNGFVLPDTTNRSLEEEFPFVLTPEEFIPFVQASEVTAEDGMLVIKLKLKLN